MRCSLKTVCRGVLVLAITLVALPPAPAAGSDTEGVKIRYQLDRDSMVTLNITRPDGWVVRELIVGQRQVAGTHEATWDGRDELGYLLPPGEYQARLLTHDGLTWHYLTSAGNSGTPPWRTPDGAGGWGGNHGQNTAVAVDETGAYLGWVSTEGPPCIVKRTHDGAQGIWHMELGPFEGVALLAVDATHLYGANANRLVVIDRDKHQVLASIKLAAGPDGPVTAIPAELTKFSWGFATHQELPKADPLVWGLAAGGGRVYVGLPWRDRIEAFEVTKDAAGKIELKARPEDNLPAPKPAGLVYDQVGALLVALAGKGQVVRFDLKTKARQVVAEGLNLPFALARAGDRTLYVSEGPPSHQIKKLGPDGKLVAAFGRAGGPRGDNAGVREYVADAFWQPCALAANPDGSVWFVDDMFKRHGRLSPEGKLLYEGFGAVNYAASCALNPNDPTELFTTMWCDLSFRIDYAKPGWFRPARRLDAKWGGESLGLEVGWGPQRLLSRAGKTYMWTGSGLSIIEKESRRPAMCFLPRIPDKGPLAELAAKRGAKNRGWNTDVVMWCDLNGDAAAQPEEVQFVPLPGARHGPQYFGEGAMNDDFSLVTYGYAWKPTEFTAAGVPVYRGDAIQFSEKHNQLVDFGGGGTQPIRMPSGGYIAMAGHADPGYPPGQGFWSGRASGQSFMGMAGDWRPLWRVGRKARGIAGPGEIYHHFRSIGQLHGCAFFDDVEGCVHVIHQDGFYLQRVLQDGWRTSRVGPDVLGVENFSGSVFQDPKTGRRTLTISSEQATHVFELKGFESIRVHPPRPVRLETARVPRESGPVYHIHRVPAGSRAMPGHAGGFLPVTGLTWPRDVEPIVLRRAGRAVSEVRMLHDGKTLWVLAHSLIHHGETPGALKPKGEFVNGDPLAAGETIVVLLQAQGAPGTKKDEAEALLDQRPANRQEGCPFRFAFANVNTRGLTVVSQWQGEPIPGQVGAPDLWDTGPSARLDRQPYGAGVCYQLAIPLMWVLKGQDLTKPVKARLDVGLVTRDPTTQRSTVVYWAGRNAAMNDPADHGFHPDGWNEAVLEVEPVAGGSGALARASKKNWSTAPTYPIGSDNLDSAPARFQVAWDTDRFSARVHVRDATPLVNRASEPPMLFKGGDAVAFTFGKTGKGGADQKVIVAEVAGKAVATLYRPQSDVKQPYTFRSPVSTVMFDYVAPLPEAKVEFRREKDGYVAEVEIPWSALRYQPHVGLAIPFDVQTIFSDPTGSASASCAWWRSVSADAHANNDIPTEIRLYSAEWGKLLLNK